MAVSPSDREKTVFTAPISLFEITRVPFGLSDAHVTFQRLRHKGPAGYILGKLSKHGLKLKTKKCFETGSAICGPSGFRKRIPPDPDKVKCIQVGPIPNTVKQLQSFLGLAGYNSRFVMEFAKIASPLNKLLVCTAQKNTKNTVAPNSMEYSMQGCFQDFEKCPNNCTNSGLH